jgi:heme/copper-type cytochrome/quinol oxidase subunit 2
MKSNLTILFFVPGIWLLCAATKPEHSIHNAIFWLLVVLAVLIAAVALKVLFGIADRGIELWRNRQKIKAAKIKKSHLA